MNRLIVFFSVFASIAFLSLSCKDTGVQPPDDTFTLTVDDASCTEVYLSLKIGAGVASRTITLKRDKITLFSKTINAAETVITDTSLLPNHTYNYTAQLLNSSLTCTSTAQTMDTTSHSFTFTTTLLGDGTGSSVLYDVAIINDTLAYAVGEIYIGGTLYNLAKWNGQTWNLQQLLFQGIPPVIHSVFAINNHDVWLDPWFHWNGQSFQELAIDPVFIGVGINKIWGNSNDLYVVGNNGFIAHYNGSNWTKIESGTTNTIQDIWGEVNTQTGERYIYCAVSHPLGYGDKKILSIDANNDVTSIPWSPQAVVMSVWFETPSFVYTCGAGIYRRDPDQSWDLIGGATVLNALTEHIRGQGNNDIFIAGDFGNIMHYNGTSFCLYPEVTNVVGTNSVFKACAIKGNMVIAVGYLASELAVIVIGKR